ncbi:hypothetical protein IAQ61_011815 [Plenodomus lingam]|uniref:uncharacterized protein n=1 Tax=Leptosphaeria maculans TaxID=5022 RepID=UPI003317D8C9|nr:hypothetical protein IAQ61_011815 [Plenodomus lingam]
MAPSDNQLNLISTYDNEYEHLFSMSTPANRNGYDAAYDMAEFNEPASWASDVPSAMPDIADHSVPGSSDMFRDGSSIDGEDAQYADTNSDKINDLDDATVTNRPMSIQTSSSIDNIATMSSPMGVQASSGFVEESEIKSEGEDARFDYVSYTPSYTGEYEEEDDHSEESDEGSFESSRAKTIPKTNKDGARRKPRQPRAKLLKWGDNDWKNVVLGIIWACGETGVQIPFDQAAQIVGESCTAGALQQAVLKLRQKQVAEGNWIPSLRMAWTRKSRNSDPSLFDANDAKVSKEVIKSKTMLPKKKATRFVGNQTLLITLKYAYREADQEHLEAIKNLGSKIKGALQTPLHSRQRAEEQRLAKQRARDSNRKARIHDSVLTTYLPLDDPTGMPTPALTPTSATHTQLGSPATGTSQYNEFIVASRGGVEYIPGNMGATKSIIARFMGSRASQPQGAFKYTPYSRIDPSAAGYVMDRGIGEVSDEDSDVFHAQAALDVSRGDTEVKDSLYGPKSAEDPFALF